MLFGKWDMDFRRYREIDVAGVEPLGMGYGYFVSHKFLAQFHCPQEPDGGMMKGLAFAYDPDGYWVEIIRRGGLKFDPPSED